ncbi:tryptophanyl-tRNA synthetase [Byssothecium circinans]|uniref:Tryptophan--tRNA ligase, mitochondrial n=1 Tax=Byssothecium circinans TaxID=147558 RepID=A0A6A5TX79_9PLEO|nr:tryptophanyl-tRNA synthetase [Byssothecium circinans]
MLSSTTSRALRRATSHSLSKSRTPYVCLSCQQKRHVSSNEPRRTIFSGIQPTGIPHLGNYLGALKPWVKLQNDAQPRDKLIFSIVDLHAITVKQDRLQLMQWRREMFASFLAVGLDPKRSVLFAQSDVSAHSEMMWILSCFASMGYLSRMTQWKSKAALPPDTPTTCFDPSPFQRLKKDAPAPKLGLFSYPVLQAADILLYNTTHVPVGEDQAQHLEFTRDLAQTFNAAYKSDILTLPETILSPARRVMSLTEPTKKMSKSDPKIESRILITDTRETIHQKIKTALTDSIPGVHYDPELRPGVSNLIDILYHLNEAKYASPEHLSRELAGADTSLKALKEMVADALDKELEPVRERMGEAMNMKGEEMLKHLDNGLKVAGTISQRQIHKMKKEMGMWWGGEGERMKRGRDGG